MGAYEAQRTRGRPVTQDVSLPEKAATIPFDVPHVPSLIADILKEPCVFDLPWSRDRLVVARRRPWGAKENVENPARVIIDRRPRNEVELSFSELPKEQHNGLEQTSLAATHRQLSDVVWPTDAALDWCAID
eukprot:4360584-Amphidinium_carterae.1